MLKKYGDIYASVFLLIFSATMYISSFSIKQLTVAKVGSQFLPKVIAIGIFLLSLSLLFQAIKKILVDKKADKLKADTIVVDEKLNLDLEATGIKSANEVQAENPKKYLAVLITLGLIIVYVIALPYLGFILASVAYLFSQMCLLAHETQRKYLLFLVISIFVSVSVYYLFKHVLYLMLPAGILG